MIKYKIPAPTVLDFLKVYLKEVLGIGHQGNTSLKKEEKDKIPTSSDTPEGLNLLIYKMSMYLAKMSMHHYELSGKKPSLVGVGAIYVALKIFYLDNLSLSWLSNKRFLTTSFLKER